MSVASINGSRDFRVGDVLGRAWQLLAGNILFFLLVPAVIYVAMVIAFVTFGLTIGLAGWASGSTGLIGVGIALAVIIALCLTMLGQGVLLLGAFQRLRGQRLRVSEVLQRALARFAALIGLSILWSLGLVLAMMAGGLVVALLGAALGPWAVVVAPAAYVPAVMLLVMWAVVVPACVIEGLGPIDSMIRSFDLTKGCRWKVFGIMLLVGLLYIAAFIVQVILTRFSQTLASVFALIWFVAWIAYWNCVVIMTYHDLRVAKEGIDTEQVATIFD